MQRVDPFIPVTKRRRPAHAVRPAIPNAASRGRSMDGFTRSTQPTAPSTPQPRWTTPRPQPPQTTPPRPQSAPRPIQPQSPIREVEQQMIAKPPNGRLKKTAGLLAQLLVLVCLLTAGLFLRSVLVGQILIIVYAVVSFVLKIESRTTFALVLISFGVVLVASLRSDTALASTFAVYAFLLLVIGTIALGRELRSEV